MSTTIDTDTYAYLHSLVKKGRAGSVGEAVDKPIGIARKVESRAALELATSAYFQHLTADAAAEESDLENALSAAFQEIDFDQL